LPRTVLQWVFDAILIIVVAISALAIYGRWHDRHEAASDYKCWGELNATQRETYLSLTPWNRQQFNFTSCLDSEIFLSELSNYPKEQRDSTVYQAIIANHGHIPSAFGHSE
jgi:hypothetical protein